jgi:ribonuclease VapC
MRVVDGSALARLTLGGEDADKAADRLEGANQRLTHPLAVYAAAAAIARETGRSIDAAYHDLADMMAASEIELVVVGQAETITALEAHARYGKGGRHPTQLNMAECFSYALAKLRSAELVYVGLAFADTDLA